MSSTSFTLSETFALGGHYSWRLKEGEIRYRGTEQFANLVLRRIPASPERIAKFQAALELLDIWNWRSDYDPEDLGWVTMDGSSWGVTFELAERKHQAGGVNAYPSFESPLITSCNHERFALLKAALYEAFFIDSFIHEARLFAERQSKLREDHRT